MNVDFYDPDGYYFDKEGLDEYGGYYDGIYYVPGEGNRHEFEDLYYEEDDYEDELIRQFERGHQEDDDDYDEVQERLYREFKKKEKDIYVEDDEEEDPDVVVDIHPVEEVKQTQMSTAA